MLLRVFILLILIFIAIEDIKTKSVSSIFLYAINVFQIVSAYMIKDSLYFENKLIFAIVIFAIYFSFKYFRRMVGEADIIFLCLQLISLDVKSFIIFWWIYLIISLIYGIILYVDKNDSHIPMFPAFALGELSIIIYLGGIL
ncbi:hypothetical protein [Ezakiella peruensis]|uniref:hypothetical protein n=1 Tax=Ezakiella peruensis TaxID=1464038 RepID=UPI00147390F5|nr:hypothetical protein [Ezakiella peruensis]